MRENSALPGNLTGNETWWPLFIGCKFERESNYVSNKPLGYQDERHFKNARHERPSPYCSIVEATLSRLWSIRLIDYEAVD